MKDTLQIPKTQRAKNRFSLFTFCLLLAACCFVTGLSCDKTHPGPKLGTRPAPGAVAVDKLVPIATQIVSSGLLHEDPYVRTRAVEVVATTGQIKLMPKVQRLLENDFVSPVRFAAVLAIGDIEYRFAEKSVRPLLNDPDENIRIAAAYAMNKLGAMDSARTLEVLRKAIASDDQVVRANAAYLMGKSGDKRARKYLYMVIRTKDSSEKVIFQAVESIAMLGDEHIFTPKLWPMVISTYADDRIMGIRAMGALGTPKAKEVLITKLDDHILAVRLVAAEQLGRLGDTTGEPEVLDVFSKNLTAGLNPAQLEHINMLTALAIGQIRTESLSRFLPQLLRDQSEFVRLAAAKAVFQYAMKK